MRHFRRERLTRDVNKPDDVTVGPVPGEEAVDDASDACDEDNDEEDVDLTYFEGFVAP